MRKFYIYTLDINGKIFYVGKTKDIKNRLRKHKSESSLKRTYKEKYINKLLKESKEINILILDEVDEDLVNYWEIYWIDQFKQWGFILTNSTSGGEGGDYWTGRKHSIETKNKLSKIRIKQIENGMIYNQPGELNGRSKLKEEQVKEIRYLRDMGYSYNKIAIKFEVSKTTIMDIIKRKKWKHV